MNIADYGNLEYFLIDDANDTIANATWSNGYSTYVQLKRIGNTCMYKGVLTEDANSRLLVTGCDEEMTNIQIQSLIFGDTFGISVNGTVEELLFQGNSANEYRYIDDTSNITLEDDGAMYDINYPLFSKPFHLEVMGK